MSSFLEDDKLNDYLKYEKNNLFRIVDRDDDSDDAIFRNAFKFVRNQ